MLAIPYPPDFEIDYHADLRAQREEAIMRGLDVSDLLAEIDTILASEPDEKKHPLFAMAEFTLNQRVAVHGGQLYTDLKALCVQALNNCINDALEQD